MAAHWLSPVVGSDVEKVQIPITMAWCGIWLAATSGGVMGAMSLMCGPWVQELVRDECGGCWRGDTQDVLKKELHGYEYDA
jgi:hypothetical protein